MENRIKEARISAGFTQKNIYELLGIPPRTLQDWESGRRTPASWLEDMVVRELNELQKNENSQG